jgi:phytoene synthase
VTGLDPDRILALSYVPASRREALAALWRLDAALGNVVAGGGEAMIGRIKLAWWREALEGLDRAPAPAEPVLRALQAHVISRGIDGAALAAMEAGWAALLSDAPLGETELGDHATARGGLLFRHSARLLGGAAEEAGRAGEIWALVDFARRSTRKAEAEAAVAAARSRAAPARRWPGPLRPLGMLAALAARDLDPRRARWEAQGAPGRMLRMLRMRLTGR